MFKNSLDFHIQKPVKTKEMEVVELSFSFHVFIQKVNRGDKACLQDS